jgi:hypothetical protein
MSGNLRIYYDSTKTKEIEERIWAKWGDQKKDWAKQGYNVSECSSCEMKTFNRRTGVEETKSKQMIGFMVFGTIAEIVMTSIYPEDQRQYEANLNELVWGHMDVYENFMNPLEGKATAKRIFKAKDLPINWVMQLINYITMSKGNKGWLVILDIFTRSISAFCIELPPEDKLSQIEVLMDKVSRFDKAILAKDAIGVSVTLNIAPEEYELCNFKHNCSRRLECKAKYAELKKSKA